MTGQQPDDELAVLVLARFTGEQLLALADRRLDAERLHDYEVLALRAEQFWTEIESDPDTNAAFARLVAERRDGLRTRSPRPTASPAGSGRAAYAQAALRSEIAWLAQAEVGERNMKLNLSSFRLGQLVDEHLDRVSVVEQLVAAGRMLGLADREIESTVRSGLAAGMQRPRR